MASTNSQHDESASNKVEEHLDSNSDSPINKTKKVKPKKGEGCLLQTLYTGCMILVIGLCMLALYFFLNYLNNM